MWLCWLCVDCECFVECFFEYFILSVHTLCWLWILCWVWLWILYVDCIYFVLTVNILHRLWIFCIECVLCVDWKHFVLTVNTLCWLCILRVDCEYFVLTVTVNTLLLIPGFWWAVWANGPGTDCTCFRVLSFQSEMWQESGNNKYGVLRQCFCFHFTESESSIHPTIHLSPSTQSSTHPFTNRTMDQSFNSFQ